MICKEKTGKMGERRGKKTGKEKRRWGQRIKKIRRKCGERNRQMETLTKKKNAYKVQVSSFLRKNMGFFFTQSVLWLPPFPISGPHVFFLHF